MEERGEEEVEGEVNDDNDGEYIDEEKENEERGKRGRMRRRKGKGGVTFLEHG